EYVTDKWHKPSTEPGANKQTCSPIRDSQGNELTDLNPDIAPNCLEVPINGEQTKDGAFDGGYSFADYWPNGFDETAHDPDTPCLNADGTGHEATSALVAGNYVTHVIMPQDPQDSRTCNPTTSTIGKQVSDEHGDADPTGCLYRIEREEDVNV